MDFNNNKAIYEQMADRMCDEIIAGNYRADDRNHRFENMPLCWR